jgi:hypothetical protein
MLSQRIIRSFAGCSCVAPNLRLDTVPPGASATADPAWHVLMVITAGSNRDAGMALGVIGGGMYNFHNVVISRI